MNSATQPGAPVDENACSLRMLGTKDATPEMQVASAAIEL
jgi:hypothetical protein